MELVMGLQALLGLVRAPAWLVVADLHLPHDKLEQTGGTVKVPVRSPGFES